MKFAIIVPTYNDADTIIDTLASIKAQDYRDYNVAIVDDGSTDSTAKLVGDFLKENKLKTPQWNYLRTANGDQLNAVIKGSKAVSGDYYFILHSDDLLPQQDFLQKSAEYILSNPGYQAYTGDLVLINEHGKITGVQKYKNYYRVNQTKLLTRTQLCLGRNQCIDSGFFGAEFFLKEMMQSYLLWNTPFWLNPDGRHVYSVSKMPFPILKYRRHDHNYDVNYRGQLNIINGELRTAAIIAANFSIPLSNIQYCLYRLFNKMGLEYYPAYLTKPQVKKDKYFRRIVKKRLSGAYVYDPFMRSLIKFYENYHARTIHIEFKKDFHPYYGKDNNSFNRLNLLGQLPAQYTDFMTEMQKGFNRIAVKNKTDQQKAKIICKFFCIHPDVKIVIEKQQ